MEEAVPMVGKAGTVLYVFILSVLVGNMAIRMKTIVSQETDKHQAISSARPGTVVGLITLTSPDKRQLSNIVSHMYVSVYKLLKEASPCN